MEIYLLRHGISEDPRPGKSDYDRALTPKGVKRLGELFDRIKDAGIHPSRILSSPLVRAVETAKIAASSLRHEEPVITTDTLVPGGRPEKVWDEIRIHADASQLLLVGHEPLMSSIYAHLLGAPQLMVHVRKGSLGRIDMDGLGTQPHGILRWLITADLLG